MSDFVFKLQLQSVLGNPAPNEAARFEALANLISFRLNGLAQKMEDRDYIFEAGETTALAYAFAEFAEGIDTSCMEFTRLWDDLTDWGMTSVKSGRHEKSLCSIPNLPQEFSC